jgi:hypothetical protein
MQQYPFSFERHGKGREEVQEAARRQLSVLAMAVRNAEESLVRSYPDLLDTQPAVPSHSAYTSRPMAETQPASEAEQNILQEGLDPASIMRQIDEIHNEHEAA